MNMLIHPIGVNTLKSDSENSAQKSTASDGDIQSESEAYSVSDKRRNRFSQAAYDEATKDYKAFLFREFNGGP
jgi:hypothetical protein